MQNNLSLFQIKRDLWKLSPEHRELIGALDTSTAVQFRTNTLGCIAGFDNSATRTDTKLHLDCLRNPNLESEIALGSTVSHTQKWKAIL